MQVLGLASVVGVLVVAGVSAASTLRNQGTSESTSEGTVVSDAPAAKAPAATPKRPAPKPEPVVQQSAAVNTPAPDSTSISKTVTVPASTPVAPAPDRALLEHGAFVLVDGRTQIADSIYAIRTGDSVIVNFDAYGFRTRRADRIENSLRLTLPMILGKTATASFDTMPAGSLVTNRDVIGALATDGMRLTLDNGSVVRLRVLTRVVSDGPIAIGYLATLVSQ